MILGFLSVLDFLGSLAGLAHPWVRIDQAVRCQQNLVHLWLRGNLKLLAVLGLLVYLENLVDPSARMVLGIPFLPWRLLVLELQDPLDLLGFQDLL